MIGGIDMENKLFDFFKKWGPFAVLFVGLLIFVLMGYEKREAKLMDFIKVQSEINVKVSATLEQMNTELCDIKEEIKDVVNRR